MNQGDRQQLKEVLERLERIERAILGDSEHEVWGYKQKWRHLDKRVSDIEEDMLKTKEHYNEQFNTLTDAMAKAEGFKAAIIVIATLFGGALGSVLTLILTAGGS